MAMTPPASVQPDRIDRHRQIGRRPAPCHRRGRQRARRGRRGRRADRDPGSCQRRRRAAARRRGRRRFSIGAGGAAGRPAGHPRRAGGAAQEHRRVFAEPDRLDADFRASIGAGDAQRAAVHRSRPQGPRTGVGALHRAAQAGKLRNRPTSSRTGTSRWRSGSRSSSPKSSASAASSVSWRRRWRN